AVNFFEGIPREQLTPQEDFIHNNAPELRPSFTDHQIEIIQRYAEVRTYEPGEHLFYQRSPNAPLIFIREGSIDLIDNAPTGTCYIARVDAPGMVGDISMFTGEPAVAACIAGERTTVWQLCGNRTRQLIAEHSELGDLILRTLINRRQWLEGRGYGAVMLIGPRWDPKTSELRDFIGRNQIPLKWLDPEDGGEGAAMAEQFRVQPGDGPVAIVGQYVCRQPDLQEFARHAGMQPKLKTEPYDLLVIGGGPAGLAATVYGASEGLDTCLLDARSPGGQAGTSSKIENYLGFATGISGEELARQAVLQARKFGATLCNPRRALHLDCGDSIKRVHLDDDTVVQARTVVLAMGASYRKLVQCANCDEFEGRGVYYAAGRPEAIACGQQSVAVVGAGNSAGQAAIYLARNTPHVTLIVRGPNLHRSMSRYLIDRIEKEENIEVLVGTQVAATHGDRVLEQITLTGGQRHGQTINCGGLFVMIGAQPNTKWLADGNCVGLDDHGFVLTGLDAAMHPVMAEHWKIDRAPQLLETTRPGVLAVGDVRSGSTKRVASGVGEGTQTSTLFATMDAKFGGNRALWISLLDQSFQRWGEVSNNDYIFVNNGSDDW
ncbi:MAG: FAD-dependent oxidoreductase, partial [Planctomycetota bacterium]